MSRRGKLLRRRPYAEPPPVGATRKLAGHITGRVGRSKDGEAADGLGKGTVVRIERHTEAHATGAYGPGCYVSPLGNHKYRGREFYIQNSQLRLLINT